MEASRLTNNETLALMHESTADALSRIADHVEKWQYSNREIVEFLRELRDEMNAQAVVVELRDKINEL